jgi:hypothetical protein
MGDAWEYLPMWKLLKEISIVAVKINLDRTLKEILDQVLKTIDIC